MNKHLLTGLIVLLFAACGCRTSAMAPELVPISGQGFVKEWQADLATSRDPITQLHVRDDFLIAYTRDNNTYWMSAAGGRLQQIHRLASAGLNLLPPVSLTNRIVIPTTSSLEIFDRTGRKLESLPTPRALESPGAAAGDSLLLGVTYPGSGRLAKIDIGERVELDWELYTTSGMVAAPAVVGDAVYAAGVDGRVWAVDLARSPIWSLDGGFFQTSGAITGDIVADDFGVYVASQDTKLYCLDRSTGKIKWTYHAGAPLLDGPVVLNNLVLQTLPRGGLVAINKTEGNFTRAAAWIQPLAQQVLAADDKHIYVRSGTTIVALDRATGEPRFRSTRNDLVVFATNKNSSLIYAATRKGTVLGIRPVLRPGGAGEIVFEEHVISPALAMAR